MKARLACNNCRLRKRKCDRIYPICTGCYQTSSRCYYRVAAGGLPGSDSSSGNKGGQQDATAVTTEHAVSQTPQLGTVVHSHDFPVSPELRSMVSDIASLNTCWARYLKTIDPWMPLVPSGYISQCLARADTLLPSDHLLLLACIKLLATKLDLDDSACTKDYLTVKTAFVQVEACSAITLRTTQARFLVLIYEFGHGVHNATHVSLVACMEYLSLLALDNSYEDAQQRHDWLIGEQVRRLWWAGFVFDRALSLDRIERLVTVKDLSQTKLLPSDEGSWHAERPIANNAITLSSPPIAHMGNFRLLVLASNLLGLALEYRADIDLRNASLVDQVQQLYRTLTSFAKVLEIEGQFDVSIGAARCILNSAVLILYPDYRPLFPEPPNASAPDNSQLSGPRGLSAEIFLDRGRVFMAGGLAKPEESAPFLIYWGYHTFRFYYHAYYSDRSDANLEAVKDLTDIFWSLNKKWKLAGVYLKLISSSQAA